jgi:hypothetical protein
MSHNAQNVQKLGPLHRRTRDLASVHVTCRMPAELIERVDQHVVKMSERQPGVIFTRTDALRVLVARGLDDIERPRGNSK